MLNVQVVNKINFPVEWITSRDLEHIAQAIIIPEIVRGIDDGMSVTGGALPRNDPKTIKRKGRDEPLVDTGTLRRSFFHRLSSKSKVIISIDSERKKIGGYLQNDGITTDHGKKFYRFFGITKYAEDTAVEYARQKISEVKSGNRSSTK